MRGADNLLQITVQTLRRCGNGRDECVVYWTGPCDELGVDQVVHPVHRVGAYGYVIDERWLQTFWVDLARQQRTARVQVHTHGGQAFHSDTDDRFPLVAVPDFLSLVIPRFAADVSLPDDAYLVALQDSGSWRSLPLEVLTAA